ncbi:hypothetical protein [Flexivirga oryzae]|uniref:Uncharacterized protein n=1 Tax=Flexivirga oryzae TaxID=1794944 RepID=A0A839N3W6_9MICO|nr:hypothetical protein [Flexivirga oryzae]MBB2892450.1 hypothetical protein [Flexivirga oryzae]
MLWLILALVIGVSLAGAVIGVVAVPARREGREVLTERAEQVVSSVTERRGRKADASPGQEERAAS